MLQDGVEFAEEFTREHKVLLFLISKYSRLAKSEDGKEQYIRELALRTFIYEGILKKLFPDYDYAPMSLEVLGGRRYLNISQEGEDDLVDLRENHLIECLKVSSSQYLPMNAYRINEKGVDAIEKACTADIRQAVGNLVNCPQCRSLLEVAVQVLYTGEENDITLRVFCPQCNYAYISTISDMEEVSYDLKPYYPKLPHAGLVNRVPQFSQECE